MAKLAIAILVVGAVVGAAAFLMLQEKSDQQAIPADGTQQVAQPGSGESTGVPPADAGKAGNPRFKIEYCGG